MADDTATASDDTDQASNDDTGSTEDQGSTETGSTDDTETSTGPDAGEVEALRKEAAKYRRQRNEARSKAEELEAANLSDSEKVQHERDTLAAQLETLTAQQRTDRLNVALATHAVDAGIAVDEAFAFVAADIEFDDEGLPIGVPEAVAKLVKERPHLVRKSGKVAPGQGTGAEGDDGGKGRQRFTRSEIAVPAFYRKHEQEILAAMHRGDIIDE